MEEKKSECCNYKIFRSEKLMEALECGLCGRQVDTDGKIVPVYQDDDDCGIE